MQHSFKIAAVAALCATSFAAHAEMTMDANLELDTTYQGKVSAPATNARDSDLNMGGRVEFNVGAKATNGDAFVAGRASLLLKKDGDTGVDDMWVQFGNAGTYVDVEDNGGMTELLAGEAEPTPDRVLRMTQDTGLGIDVLTAPAIFVPLTAMTAELAQRIVDVLSARYAHVVIDLPRAALDWVEPVVRASDRLLLVSDGSVPCIRQAKRMIDLYRELEPTLKIDVVMNRERKPLFGSNMQRDAEDLLQIKLESWVAKDDAGERRAIDLGRPSVCKRSRNRNSYRSLARRLMASRGDTNFKSGK